MSDRKILWLFLIVSLLLLPTMFRKPSIKNWVIAFLLNAFSNAFVAVYLAGKNFLVYPTRIMPSVFISNIVYDYLICPLISAWFCQATKNSKVPTIFLLGVVFTFPQILIELFMLHKTNLLKYKNGWTWKHSFIGIYLTKLFVRTSVSLIHKLDTSIKGSRTANPIEEN